MAIPQSKNSNGKNQSGAGARFRQRKISVKQALAIFRHTEINSSEGELEPSQINHLSGGGNTQQRDANAVETGVDKNEEDEVHLQQVINAAQKALLSSQNEDGKADVKGAYIPTPDASRIWPEASKYYSDHDFIEPETYIKYSAQVEDAIGVDYNMDEEDEEFLNTVLNKKAKKNDVCTEVEFEIVASKLEKFIKAKQPFLSIDPTKILSYKELSAFIIEEFKNSAKNKPYIQMGTELEYLGSNAVKERLSKELKFEPFVTIFDKHPFSQDKESHPRPITKLLDLFGESIYNHWKDRKIARNGKGVFPELKFEDPNANEKDNDNDPYICFRRREFRQARKTRRADTLGIERIRQLQKSLHRARDLMFSVSQREILKLEAHQQEVKVFELRKEAKNVKRAHNITGDDQLFYPHKKKRVVKIKEEEDEREREREREYKLRRERKIREARGELGISRQLQQAPSEGTSSSTQPYVKLPPSKIPDIDLITVSLVLKEKNDTIRKAVSEKLRKRKEQDNGYVNLTDDPYQPYFKISTNGKLKSRELKHTPYSSIASASLHQMDTANVLNPKLKDMLEDTKTPLPGMKTFNGKNGELVPSSAFPHLQTLLNDHIQSKKSGNGYIDTLLNNIENRQFNCYINGYGNADPNGEFETQPKVSDPLFRLRRRVGRGGRAFVDRRVMNIDPVEEFMKFEDMEVDRSEDSVSGESVGTLAENKNISNVYMSNSDQSKRYKSNWLFDNETKEYETSSDEPFSLDPSKLNSISDDTQSIRFGSMLLSKSYELLRESVHQRQQAYIQQVRMRAALQQQQMRNNQRNLQRAQQQQQQQQQSTQGSGEGTTTGGSSSSGSSLSTTANSQTNSQGSPRRTTTSHTKSSKASVVAGSNRSSGSNGRA